MNEQNNVGVPGLLDFVAIPVGPSPDGGTWVGLGREATFVERFSQSLTGLSVGTQYTVSWFFGNFGYAGVAPPYNAANAIEVLLDGVSAGANQLLGPAPIWTPQSIVFTATATTQELSFQPFSGNKSYISIDGIFITETGPGVPEPKMALLLAGGLGFVALMSKRHR